MRFSALFQSLERQPQPVPRLGAVRAQAPIIEVAQARELPLPAPPQLPEDLDARVRLVGEWQLGEAQWD